MIMIIDLLVKYREDKCRTLCNIKFSFVQEDY